MISGQIQKSLFNASCCFFFSHRKQYNNIVLKLLLILYLLNFNPQQKNIEQYFAESSVEVLMWPIETRVGVRASTGFLCLHVQHKSYYLSINLLFLENFSSEIYFSYLWVLLISEQCIMQLHITTNLLILMNFSSKHASMLFSIFWLWSHSWPSWSVGS